MPGDSDDDSHTTLGGSFHHHHLQQQQQQQQQNDASSDVDLLADSSPPSNQTTSTSSMLLLPSPATQTLDLLSSSQREESLRYDFSQLDKDASAMEDTETQLEKTMLKDEPEEKEVVSQQPDMKIQQQETEDVPGQQEAAQSHAQPQHPPPPSQDDDEIVDKNDASKHYDHDTEESVLVEDYADWPVFGVITLSKPGLVGMNINRKYGSRNFCYAVVTKIRPGWHAQKAGVHLGDVICSVSSTTEKKEWIPFDDMLEKFLSKDRPITFRVARDPLVVAALQQEEEEARRRKAEQQKSAASLIEPSPIAPLTQRSKDEKTSTKTMVECSHQSILLAAAAAVAAQDAAASSALTAVPRQNPSVLTPATETRMTARTSTQAALTTPSPRTDEELVPFCKACHGSTKIRSHHPMCPKHPNFDKSGALEKLALIRRGVERQCPACVVDYQLGHSPKDSVVSHLADCERNKTTNVRLRETAVVQVPAPVPPAPLRKTRAAAKPKQTKKGKNNGAKKDDGATAAAAGMKRKAPTKTQPSTLFSDGQDDVETAARLLSSFSNDRSTSNFGEQRALVPRATTAARGAQSRRVTPAGASLPSSRSRVDDTPIKPVWVPCDNPWGEPGFQQGDVVLVTPSEGYTHHETEDPHPRFAVSPFDSSPSYHNTHMSPAEGAQTLVLTRDRLAKTGWGFTFRRHEFGGACLVQTVDILSPAAAAKYRGWESNNTGESALRVHDMIIAINGQAVGGMTTLGLDVELSVCGPEVQLTVLRYKFPKQALRQQAAREEEAWSIFDEAQHDPRRLDSLEFNGQATPTKESASHLLPDDDISPISFRYGSQGAQNTAFASLLSATQMDSLSLHDESLFEDSELSTSMVAEQQAIEPEATQQFEQQVEEWTTNDDPWLGCVCGITHPEPTPVFWIRCDECNAWYNAKTECIGFTEADAANLPEWTCPACDGSDEGPQEALGSSNTMLLAEVEVGRVSPNHELELLPGIHTMDSRPTRGQQLDLRRKEPSRTKAQSDNVQAETSPMSHQKQSSIGGASMGRGAKAVKVLRPDRQDRDQRWTKDGCFIPATKPSLKPDGTYARPSGRCPVGLQWDEIRGIYVPTKRTSNSRKKSSSPIERLSSEDRKRKPTAALTEDPRPRPRIASRGRGSSRSDSVQTTKVMPIASAGKRRSQMSAEERKEDFDRRRREGGCIAPYRKPEKRPDGLFAHPGGSGPKGMHWDAVRGLWAPNEAFVQAPAGQHGSGDDPQNGAPLVDAAGNQKPRSQMTVAERKAELESRRREDGCVAPYREPRKLPDGLYAHPGGVGPKGLRWDAVRGLWAPHKTVITKEHAGRRAPHSRAPQQEGSTAAIDMSENPKPRSMWTEQERQADLERRRQADGCVAPYCEPTKRPDGTYARPSGSAPKGLRWDAARGLWKPRGDATTKEHAGRRAPHSRAPQQEETPTAIEMSDTPKPRSMWTEQERQADLERRRQADGCVAPCCEPTKRADGTYSRPSGSGPKGMSWDAESGLWALRDQAVSKRHSRQKRLRSDSPDANEDGSTTHVSKKGKVATAGESESLKPRPRSQWSQAERQADIERRRREGGCLASASTPQKLPNGTFRRPGGIAPRGLAWDNVRGLWAPKGNADNEPSQSDTILAASAPAVALPLLGHSAPREEAVPAAEAAVPPAANETPKKHVPLPVGSIVNVAKRSWPGIYKEGGIGKIMDYQLEETTGEVLYTVSYMIGGRERNIPDRFVEPHDFAGRRSSDGHQGSPSSLSY